MKVSLRPRPGRPVCLCARPPRYRGHSLCRRSSAEAAVRAHDAAQRPHAGAVGGSLDADRPPATLVSRRIEEREAGPHRIRPSVRASDVQGFEERPARSAHVDDLVGRRPEQRLHDRRRDGVLGDGARAVSAARALARSRPDGDAPHRQGHVHQRARGREGRAADARRQSAVRPV